MLHIRVLARELSLSILVIPLLMSCFYSKARAADAQPAFLTPEALIEGWESTYGSIKSMEISTTNRLIKETNPTISTNVLHTEPILHVEKIVDNDRYHTRISKSPNGFSDPTSLIEESFDGQTTMDYEAAIKRGTIYPGGSEKVSAVINDVARCLLMEPIPSVNTIPKYRWGKSVFSDDFRDFSKNSEIRPGVRVRANLESICGEACHVLECGDENAEKPSITRVWLAHEKGMLPMKYEKIMGGELAKSIEVTEVGKVSTEVGTIWYPVKATIQSGFSWTGRAEHEIAVHKFIPYVAIPPESFTISFPSGTRLYDKDRGIVSTAGTSIRQPTLDNILTVSPNVSAIITKQQGHTNSRTRTWAVIIITVTSFFLVVIVAFAKRMRSGSNSL